MRTSRTFDIIWKEDRKLTLKGKVGHFEASSKATNDLVKKIEERMLRMEEKIKE